MVTLSFLVKLMKSFEKDFDIGATTKSSLIPEMKIFGGFGRPVNYGRMFFKYNDKKKISFISEWISKMLIDLRNNPNAPYLEQDSFEKIVYGYYPNKERFKFMRFERDLYNWTKAGR
ncbi:MAG: hypothetical protein WDZ69_00040 [Candidatus Pacearchaeota archaeon]